MSEKLKIPSPFPDGYKTPTPEESRANFAQGVQASARNCMSYWFPRLENTGVPVPKTWFADAGVDWFRMMNFAEGPKHQAAVDEAERIIADLTVGLQKGVPYIGSYPVFLRTGHFSGKHEWNKACYLPSNDQVDQHIRQLVFMSEMFGSFGELPYKMWAVRELLPTKTVAVLPGYGDFPLAREVRAFISDGEIVCSHPYWPSAAIKNSLTPRRLEPAEVEILAYRANEFAAMVDPAASRHLWEPQVREVAREFKGDGSWSVDVLETERGWYITDMAEALRSWHWDGCEQKEKLREAAKAALAQKG